MNGRLLKTCNCSISGVLDSELERIIFECRSSLANKRREVRVCRRKRGWERACGKEVRAAQAGCYRLMAAQPCAPPVRATVRKGDNHQTRLHPVIRRVLSHEREVIVDKRVYSVMYDNGDYSGRNEEA
jgi:hypothetical protein